ncbi:6928_t:CDS:2 [Ambispora leptoticha]|uniref:6928_t:CDS:1 n=1 Tax=Ambispora leptoticha TaxID=144679 RepID=A0A9N8W5D1_9GLOM|nr:6928_t:CDS:2 [Ambispora leptoticha]
MYGNVGLATPRGSGTNGYVVRNLSYIRPRKDVVAFESYEEIAAKNSSALANRTPNKEILEHDKKRQVELECMLLREKLEDENIPEEEIEEKVDAHRQELLSKLDQVKTTTTIQEHQTHQLSEAKAAENEKMMKALGIDSSTYSEGAAFDKELQEQKRNKLKEQRDLEYEKKRQGFEERERNRKEAEERKSGASGAARSSSRSAELDKESRHKSSSSSSTESASDVSREYGKKRYSSSSYSKKDIHNDRRRVNSYEEKDKKVYQTRRNNRDDNDDDDNYSTDDSHTDRKERRKARSQHRTHYSESSKHRGHRREGSIPTPIPRRHRNSSASPPPRHYRDQSLSQSPPQRRRHDDDNFSLPRKRIESVSPPRRDTRRRYYNEESIPEVSASSQKKINHYEQDRKIYTDDRTRKVKVEEKTSSPDQDRKNYSNDKTRKVSSKSKEEYDAKNNHPNISIPQKYREYTEESSRSSYDHRRMREKTSPRRLEERNRRHTRSLSPQERDSYHRRSAEKRRDDSSDSEVNALSRRVNRKRQKSGLSESSSPSNSSSYDDEYRNRRRGDERKESIEGKAVLPEHLQKRQKGRHDSSTTDSSD